MTQKKDKELVLSFEFAKPQLLRNKWLWFFVAVLLTIVAIGGLLFYRADQLVQRFAKAAQLSKEEVLEQAQTAMTSLQNYYNAEPDTLPSRYTLLLLGSDLVTGKDSEAELTDTLMLLRLDLEAARVDSLSLPRDLYHQDYQTRINALYYYGQSRYPERPEQFPEEVLSELTGVTIDRTLLLRIGDVRELIDLAGGVEVEVTEAFRDEQFPIYGVDVKRVTDPTLLYETIEFAAGKQVMDGDTALKYMRSRHSGDDQGTDNARGQRQQAVLAALASKLTRAANVELAGRLYRFYLDRLSASVPLDDFLQLLARLVQIAETRDSYELEFKQHQLSVYPQDPAGLIVNPPLWQTKNEWIYQIRDQVAFKEYFASIFD